MVYCLFGQKFSTIEFLNSLFNNLTDTKKKKKKSTSSGFFFLVFRGIIGGNLRFNMISWDIFISKHDFEAML